MGNWACRGCGVCCTQTIARSPEGHLFGLYLDAEEVPLFPAELVFPLLGRGAAGEEIATAWQLGVTRCPNYEGEEGLGRCRVYARRPRVCAAFPVTSRSSVSPHCPAVREIADGVEPASVARELAAHQEKLLQMIEREPDWWVWPLDKKCWIPMENVVYLKPKR